LSLYKIWLESQVFSFCEFGLEMPIHAPFGVFLGDLTPKWGGASKKPSKGTSLCGKTSYDV